MKALRRIAACLLIFVFCSNRMVFAGESSVSAWAAQEVEEAVRLGLVPEHLQDRYTADITRAEFAEIAVYFLALQYRVDVHEVYSYFDPIVDENGNIQQNFTDVQNIFVDAAYRFGIVNGRGNGVFDPDSPITREEAAQMLYNTYRIYAETASEADPSGLPERFSDSGTIAAWAEHAVAFVTEWNVMNGISEDEFSAKGHYTREQCCLTFLRLYENAPCSRLYGTAKNLWTYEEMTEDILNQYSYELYYSGETDICTVFYGVQTAARVGGYSFWIVYKDGGRKNLWEQFPHPYHLFLNDFTFNEDGTELYCTQNKTGDRCRIDLEQAVVEVMD